MTRQWAAPKNRRTTWGAMRSTKPMMPTKAVAVPVSTAMATSSTHFIRRRATPMAWACSSPKVITSISREKRRKNRVQSRVTGASTATWLHSLEEKLPSVHRLICWA